MSDGSPDESAGRLVKTRLTVLCWNLAWRFDDGWEAREPLILDVLRAADADVVALQEVWDDGEENQAERLGRSLGLNWTYEKITPIDGVDLGLAVLSRWPIAGREGHALPSMPSAGGRRDRRAMFAAIDGPRGHIGVFNTHLSWPLEESHMRQEQVRSLVGFVAQTRIDGFPPVVCGDFNAPPSADEIRMMTGETTCPVEGLYFIDAWSLARPGEPGYSWSNRNPLAIGHFEPDRRLDYIFVGAPADNGAGHVLRARLAGVRTTRGLPPSDHYAVIADLRY